MFTLTSGLTEANVGKTAELSAVISSKNYTDFTVTVNVTLTDKENQEDFGFEMTEKTVTYGDDDFAVAATGNMTGSVVTYTSSDETVATVDEKGKVTVLKAGSTVIKAEASATNDYKAAEDTYTLTVNKAALTITVKDLNVYKGAYKGLDIPFVLEYKGFVKGEDETVLETASSKPMAVVSIPNETTFIDAEGTTVTPVESDIRIAVTSELTPEDKAALEVGLTDPQHTCKHPKNVQYIFFQNRASCFSPPFFKCKMLFEFLFHL